MIIKMILIILAIMLLAMMIKYKKNGGLLEWIIIIAGLISAITLVF